VILERKRYLDLCTLYTLWAFSIAPEHDTAFSTSQFFLDQSRCLIEASYTAYVFHVQVQYKCHRRETSIYTLQHDTREDALCQNIYLVYFISTALS
jgi:hypothetical protein